MKLKYLAILLFPLSLAACQSSDLQRAGDLAVSVLQQQNADKIVSAYQWSLDTGTAKPLTLNFNDNGRLSIGTSCNQMGGNWQINNNQLQVGMLISTEMACEASAMQQERFAAALFQKPVSVQLDMKNTQQPSLILTAADGQQHTFQGKMTPETKYQSAGETIFLEISPETKACTGVAPQTCLQVREVKYNEQGLKTQVDQDWTLFYDQIEGFQHNPNERQIIRVKRYELKNPVADQSKYAYVHDMTVETGRIN